MLPDLILLLIVLMRYRTRIPGKVEQGLGIQLHRSLFSRVSLLSPADVRVWSVKVSMLVRILTLHY